MKYLQTKFITLMVLFGAFAVNSLADIGPAPGQRAPGFRLDDMKDNPVTLTRLRQKGHVLLVFWSTRCHVCHKMIPTFKKVHKHYKNKGLTLAAVNVGMENMPEVKKYISKHKIDYLVLNTDRQKEYVISAYSLRGTPTFKLVAPNGKILFHGHQIPDLKKYMKGS